MFPQIGVPLGMLLATGFMFGLNAVLTEEQFLEWGWRVPFLFSFVLILVAFFIRWKVEESPVFKEMKERKKESSAPLKELVTTHKKYTFLAALIFAANNAAGYLVIAFFAAYGASELGMSRTETLIASLIGGVGWFIFTMFGGWISDRIGRVRTFQIGYAIIIVWAVPMWFLLDTASLPLFALAIFILTIGLGPSYGPQSALYAEMFPVSIRFSGVSIGYALGSIIGGAFAATIAQAILDTTGQSWLIGVYIGGLAVMSFIAVSMVPKNLQGVNLQDDEEREELRLTDKQKSTDSALRITTQRTTPPSLEEETIMTNTLALRAAAAAATAALLLTACNADGNGDDASNGEGNGGDAAESYSIGITQIVSHPALDSARDGFKSAFDDAGIDVEWDEQNAQGEQATASNIAGTFATADLDLVHAIATPTSQAAAQQITDVPIVFFGHRP